MSAGRDRRRLYGDLAWTWPIISPPAQYVGESEAVVRLIRAHAAGAVRTLLNLGSGGGHNDWTLKRHLTVTGVDISPAMLALARRLNPEAAYVEGDMRSVRLGRAFDAVVCFDSIDYMLSEDDLARAFATAHAHLRPGGVFVTYAEVTRERFCDGRARAARHRTGGVEIVFVEYDTDVDPGDTTIESEYITLIRDGGALRVEADRHVTGIFAEARWPALLEAAGFSVRLAEPVALDADEDPVPTFVGVKP